MTSSPLATEQQTLPYGAWPSPITPQMLTTAAPAIREIGTVNDAICWVETRPQERGRYVLVMQTPDGPVDLTPEPFSVRNRVHEYGGASWTSVGSTIVFSNFADNRLYRFEAGRSTPQPISPELNIRFADLQINAASGLLYAIREDHRDTEHEAVNSLVVLNLDGPNADGGLVVAGGTDFISSPRISRDGTRISWLTWNHPSMPWDETQLWTADIQPDGTFANTQLVAGGPKESVILEGWDVQGRLVYVSDTTGWWNLYRVEDGATSALAPAEVEYGLPLWQFGVSTWTELRDGTLVAAFTSDGNWHLSTISPSGAVERLDVTFTSLDEVRTHPDGNRIICKAGTALEHPRVIELDPRTGSFSPIHMEPVSNLDAGDISVAQPISWPTPDGVTAHGLYYPPTNQRVLAPDGTLPPLVVISHGGPTSASPATFSLGIQFWTSRGFAILNVNYGGSTGYGRAYRDRLQGTWGVVDVDDCISGAQFLAEQGLVDAERLVIRGGSAGGFTTLAALAFRDAFAAGVSYYGIGDLEAMVSDTHKFESRYLDGLVGPYPDAIDLYRERSAIHHIDQLSSPMILLQGLDDKVVPPNQATMMADAVRERGLPVAVVLYEGEGHGFRMAETIEHSVLAELSFLGQVLGFEPAGDVPHLEIDNLD